MIRTFATPLKNSASIYSLASARAFSVNVVKDPAAVFEEITTKTKSKHLLSLRDLRHILVNAKDHKHAKFVFRGVKLYQSRGFDFSEELCSLFVKFCVQNNQAKAGAQVITKPGYRIGSWLSRKSLDQIGNALLSTNNVELAAAVLKTTADRGLKVASDELIGSVVKSTAAAGAEDKFKEVIDIVTTIAGADKATTLANKFPLASAAEAPSS